MKLSVCYASETEQIEIPVELPTPVILRQAIEKSQILRRFPEINLSVNKVGVFGVLKKLDDVLHEGDRVEIYRPLKIDPMTARRLRASKKS